MTKHKFTKKVLTMEHPLMEEGSSPGSARDLLDCYIIVSDRENFVNKFCTESVQLLRREYQAGKSERYLDREKKLKLKYEKWLFDICGNHCTSKLKIV